LAAEAGFHPEFRYSTSVQPDDSASPGLVQSHDEMNFLKTGDPPAAAFNGKNCDPWLGGIRQLLDGVDGFADRSSQSTESIRL
jgi:hypothetical protein